MPLFLASFNATWGSILTCFLEAFPAVQPIMVIVFSHSYYISHPPFPPGQNKWLLLRNQMLSLQSSGSSTALWVYITHTSANCPSLKQGWASLAHAPILSGQQEEGFAAAAGLNITNAWFHGSIPCVCCGVAPVGECFDTHRTCSLHAGMCPPPSDGHHLKGWEKMGPLIRSH